MLLKSSSLRQFFENEIFNSYQRQLSDENVLNEIVLQYLINVLLRFCDVGEFKENFTVSPVYDLVKMRQKELTTSQLQGFADYCLFKVGFFPFNFSAKANTPRENFVSAGQSAYLSISKKTNQGVIFSTLAINFIFLANLITEVKYKELTDYDILQLFQLWEETGNKLAREYLIKKGLIV